jgi:spore coat protein U-like protein
MRIFHVLSVLGALCMPGAVRVSDATPASGARDVWVEVRINDVTQPDFALLHIDMRGHLSARVEDLKAWRMQPPNSAVLFLSACLGMGSSDNAWALLQSCTVATMPVGFGLYNPLTPTANTAAGQVSVICTVTLLGLLEYWTIALSAGNSGTFTARQMLNGTSPLSYNLYATAAYSNVWGDGSGSTTLVNGGALLSIGTTETDYPVYGRIPAGQDSAAGAFLDTIVVTLNF